MPWKLWNWFAGGSGFVALALFIFLFGHGIGGGGGHFSASHKDRWHRSIFTKSCEPYPCFADSSAPGRVDNADRYVLARCDISGKVPRNGREFFRSIWSRRGPSIGI